MVQVDKKGLEESFKKTLEDVLVVLEKLQPHCESMDELFGMVRLAVGDETTPGNDSQLRLLMKLVIPQVKR